MYYELPTENREPGTAWLAGTPGVRAEDMTNGQEIEIPVAPMNVLVNGITGNGKTTSSIRTGNFSIIILSRDRYEYYNRRGLTEQQ